MTGSADRGDAPVLSALFVNYNTWRDCVVAIDSLVEHRPVDADGAPLPLEVVVVDNASPVRDAAAEAELEQRVAELGGMLVRHTENSGYAQGMNLAYRHARGDYILISNPDVEYRPGCVDRLLRYLREHDDAGTTAPEGFWDRGLHCRLPPNILPTVGDLLATTMAGISPAAVHRYSRRRTDEALRVWDSESPVDLDMLSGCCFLMKRAFIEQIGLFDPRFPLYYEDTDLSVRIRRAGKRIVQVPGAHLVHLYNRSGATANDEAMRRYWISKRAYYHKWYGRPGAALFDACRRLLGTSWAQGRSALPVHRNLHLLPDSNDKPVLELPRPLERFVVEISLDQRFYLAAGTFGSGDRWTPPDELWANFGPTTYFFRVCEVRGGRGHEVGVWRYTRIYPPEWMENA